MRTCARVGLAGGIAATAIVTVISPGPATAGLDTGNDRVSAADAVTLAPAGSGVISARGAAVAVPFTFSCEADHRAELNVSLVQALGDGFASGGGYRSLTCTGAPQRVELYVQANPYQGAQAFKAGPASVVANLYAYNPQPEGCGEGPCPDATAPAAPAKAAPPGASGQFSESSASRASVPQGFGPQGFGPQEDNHSEFHGTLTLR